MKRFFFFSLLLLCLLAWLHYSSPGRGTFTQLDVDTADLIADLAQVRRSEALRNRPVQVKTIVRASISCKLGGISLLEDAEGNQLFVLSRQLAPAAGQQVVITLIVREVLLIQQEAFLLGALVQCE